MPLRVLERAQHQLSPWRLLQFLRRMCEGDAARLERALRRAPVARFEIEHGVAADLLARLRAPIISRVAPDWKKVMPLVSNRTGKPSVSR